MKIKIGVFMDISLEQVSVNDLVEFPDNPRVGNVAEIKKSLVENLQYKPLIVNRKTMHVLVGNHTLKAMKELGYETCNVNFIEVDPLAEKKIVLADNKLSDNSEYNVEQLTNLLDELMTDGELIGTGFNADEVDDLLSTLGDAPIITDFEQFEGGYALEDDEIEKLKNNYIATETSNKEARGGERLRDVMLHYKESKYETFVEMVSEISEKLGQKKADSIYVAVEFFHKQHFEDEDFDDIDTEFEEIKDNAFKRIFKRDT
tara:strand:- start:25304 stop:26083 length:780 start_codon:yes stop_codon:yes gene_type:complete